MEELQDHSHAPTDAARNKESLSVCLSASSLGEQNQAGAPW